MSKYSFKPKGFEKKLGGMTFDKIDASKEGLQFINTKDHHINGKTDGYVKDGWYAHKLAKRADKVSGSHRNRKRVIA